MNTPSLRALLLSLAGAAALSLAPTARAVQVEHTVAQCPVGEGSVKVFRLITQNTHGG